MPTVRLPFFVVHMNFGWKFYVMDTLVFFFEFFFLVLGGRGAGMEKLEWMNALGCDVDVLDSFFGCLERKCWPGRAQRFGRVSVTSNSGRLGNGRCFVFFLANFFSGGGNLSTSYQQQMF